MQINQVDNTSFHAGKISIQKGIRISSSGKQRLRNLGKINDVDFLIEKSTIAGGIPSNTLYSIFAFKKYTPKSPFGSKVDCGIPNNVNREDFEEKIYQEAINAIRRANENYTIYKRKNMTQKTEAVKNTFWQCLRNIFML